MLYFLIVLKKNLSLKIREYILKIKKWFIRIHLLNYDILNRESKFDVYINSFELI